MNVGRGEGGCVGWLVEDVFIFSVGYVDVEGRLGCVVQSIVRCELE